MYHVSNAWRAGIPRPKGYPVLMGATIVPRANIQQKKATQNPRSVKPVSSGSFKICPATPRAVNAPVDGAIPATDRPVATLYHRGRTH
jgi:hypothetical protein